MASETVLYYLAPVVPLLTRTILCLRFYPLMADVLCEQEQKREAHRSHILALAGFSFTGLLALVVLDSALSRDFHVAIFCLLVSFLFFLFALSLQGYKSKRWQDQLGSALMDAATFCLVLSVISILISSKTPGSGFLRVLSLATVGLWLLDHLLRVGFQWKYLKVKEGGQQEMNEKQTPKKPDKELEKRELNFVTCPKHGLRYPEGSVCPLCPAGK